MARAVVAEDVRLHRTVAMVRPSVCRRGQSEVARKTTVPSQQACLRRLAGGSHREELSMYGAQRRQRRHAALGQELVGREDTRQAVPFLDCVGIGQPVRGWW